MHTYTKFVMHAYAHIDHTCVHTYTCTYIHGAHNYLQEFDFEEDANRDRNDMLEVCMYAHTYIHVYICTYVHVHVISTTC